MVLTHCNVVKKMPGVLVCWPSRLAAKVDDVLRAKFHRSPLRSNVDLAVSWEVQADSEVRMWFDGAR